MPPSPRITAAALAALLTLGAVTATTAAAGPPPPTPAAKAEPTSAKITLITGDVVEVTDAGAGKKAVTLRPAAGRERVTFHTVEIDGGVRVLPTDAVPYIANGVLDADLFDVEELIADGYGDSTAKQLPLIVKYDGKARGSASLAGTTTTRELSSIGGAAVSASKEQLPELWKALKPAAVGAKTLNSGVSKIWLDGKVRAVLDKSVPQIGAPAAWQAGYEGSGVEVAVLDTGVDAQHPDLVGKVQQAQDFSGSVTGPADLFGHGTHVAATIAGTGAGAGGTRKGVAPKADLLVGKVLGDDGYGYDSWIIAGMEWAAAEGAKVVNMSLGGGPTDGLDPLSQAVNDITARTGALFVISAGNSGDDETVGTPGAAAAALTVAAVDRDDKLAWFSSRGPRVGDAGLKPEISAPGVGIVAARAAGTAMGTPVDDLYTAASGTSMAAPHVAGAAALLAQQHPDWKAGQLKDALVSTAKTQPNQTVYAQGAGRVDVSRAISQKVTATGVADFGLVTPTEASTRTITYRNSGNVPVTLSLSAAVTNLDVNKPETDAFGVPATVTVPANGSVDVAVNLAAAKLERGLHSGWVVATGANGIANRTALGALRAGKKYKVTLRGIGRDGQPSGIPALSLFGDNSRSDTLGWIPNGSSRLTVELEEGTYLLNAVVHQYDPQDEQVSLITDPNLEITKDTEVVIDARKAAPITIETPKPSEQQAILSYYVHRVYGNGRAISHGVMHFSTMKAVNVTPTKPVKEGSYEFSSRWQLVAPIVQATAKGVTGPLDIRLLHRSPSFEGKKRFPLVYADSSMTGVKDAVAVVIRRPGEYEADHIAAAARAGAAALIIVRPIDDSVWTVWEPLADREPLPAMVITAKDGQKLIDRARKGKATIDLTLTTSSPYLYDVQQVSAGHIPAKITYKVTPSNSARITTRYADNGGFNWAKEQRFGWRPWQEYSWNDDQRFVETPKVREEWVTSGDSLWQHRVHHEYIWYTGPLTFGMAENPRSYQSGKSDETWFGPVVRPAAAPGVVSTRSGDRLALRIPQFVDQEGHYTIDHFMPAPAVLSRNGTKVAELFNGWADVTTTGDNASYKLDMSTERTDNERQGEWIWGTRTQTSWEFRSRRTDPEKATPLPLLQVGYKVPVDLTGRVGAKTHVVGFNVHQQVGAPAATSTTLKAWASFDDGKSWKMLAVAGKGGKYLALVPSAHGTVSLKVEAKDNTGASVTQTVIRAYGVR
ncbi:peptidase S8 [Kribbella turkmenica]|uniref:Peptidase S8 n=1 Tax=Kribbella turkmenica TaxID=2530375 RepID=A0A4R4XCC7_9ACTN|nr:S8 family serine peptidase [Kribbella turkmenica]TDD28059.1 peptidase S8 [Kribbella turkmenica]